MKISTHLFLYPLLSIKIVVLSVSFSFSQPLSLFNNGDFENYSFFHSSYGNVSYAKGLSSATIFPHYYNNSLLNTNTYRTITPYSGNGCIGMFANGPKYEIAIIDLDYNTGRGLGYEIEFYLFGKSKKIATDSNSSLYFGFYFFKSNSPPEFLKGHFSVAPPIPDVFIFDYQIVQESWCLYRLFYTANDIYDKVLFGWFSNPSSVEKNEPNPLNSDFKYVFIDKLSIDSSETKCSGSGCLRN